MTDQMLDWVFRILLAVLVASVLALGWLFYDEYTAEKFYLRKDSWSCSISHRESRGKFGTATICDNWVRK